jgi:Tol biopolymer transport system component
MPPTEVRATIPYMKLLSFTAIACAVLVAGSLAVATGAGKAAVAPATTRVNVSTSGRQAKGDTWDTAVSSNGRYVVFTSDAPNLVPGDTNAAPDVFMRDRVLGTTTRLSVSRTGGQANGQSFGPLAVSGDGRFVVFQTTASNIAPGTQGVYEFTVVLDRTTGRYTSLGQVGLYPPIRVAISDDGRHIAYEDEEKDAAFVVRRDLRTGLIQVLNPLHARFPLETLGGMSADGSRVFLSATDYHRRGLFVRDFREGWVRRVDLNDAQVPEDRFGRPDAISADGHHVLFQSPAANLVGGDTNGATDVFTRNVDTRRTGRVSVSGTARQANGSSVGLGLSADGSSVLFESVATNLVGGDTNGARDVFLRDLDAGATRRCDVSSTGAQANAPVGDYSGVLSRNGLWTFFLSSATNLVPHDSNGSADLFARGPGC